MDDNFIPDFAEQLLWRDVLLTVRRVDYIQQFQFHQVAHNFYAVTFGQST
jgi:hypothetical protein